MAYTNSSMVAYTKLSPNHSGLRTHARIVHAIRNVPQGNAIDVHLEHPSDRLGFFGNDCTSKPCGFSERSGTRSSPPLKPSRTRCTIPRSWRQNSMEFLQFKKHGMPLVVPTFMIDFTLHISLMKPVLID